ncbi:class IV adenylate cyclase [Acidobacteria bacterium AH-259-L09]|nr:class IV adenylate cyclase [Acidobacteria bacterium AH-259-L09]
MALETEVKIRISQKDLDRIRTRLTELGACCVSSRRKEENLLFDFSDRKLEAAGCAVRLRTYGEQATLTFKAKIQDDPLYKKREELETPVNDPEAMQEILEALGMNVYFEYSKFREIYELSLDKQEIEICLDETRIGAFVELEGSTDLIEKVAAKFGWAPELFIRKNYVEMLSADEPQTADRRNAPRAIEQ